MFIGCDSCIYAVYGSKGASRKSELICNYGYMHNTTCLKRSGIDIRNYPGIKYSADTKQRCLLYRNKRKNVYFGNPK